MLESVQNANTGKYQDAKYGCFHDNFSLVDISSKSWEPKYAHKCESCGFEVDSKFMHTTIKNILRSVSKRETSLH